MITVAVRQQLAAADARLQEVEVFRSLDPVERPPTRLTALLDRLVRPDDNEDLIEGCVETLVAVADAQRDHFPGNLFWDFDYMTATLLQRARDEGLDFVRQFMSLSLRLQAMFGCKSVIRFRYVHDFSYGLDWERWVQADPSREGIGPLDLPFLRRILVRGEEITELVARNDSEFPKLADGEWRNPFSFSRLPEHEIRLHRDLAGRDGIPVQAWRTDARPDWRRPYAALRLERARALGIPDS